LAARLVGSPQFGSKERCIYELKVFHPGVFQDNMEKLNSFWEPRFSYKA
jgi:hypothetical protein